MWLCDDARADRESEKERERPTLLDERRTQEAAARVDHWAAWQNAADTDQVARIKAAKHKQEEDWAAWTNQKIEEEDRDFR